MKLHTLDQIDPLILKLERAVKQEAVAQPVTSAKTAGAWLPWKAGEPPFADISDRMFDILIDSVEGCEKRLEAQYTSMDMWQDGFIKEYRFVGYGHPAETAPNPEPAASSLKAGDWIEHAGGPCPCAGAIVETQWRSGLTREKFRAQDGDRWHWDNVKDGGDIIAYRLVNP